MEFSPPKTLRRLERHNQRLGLPYAGRLLFFFIRPAVPLFGRMVELSMDKVNIRVSLFPWKCTFSPTFLRPSTCCKLTRHMPSSDLSRTYSEKPFPVRLGAVYLAADLLKTKSYIPLIFRTLADISVWERV
jgi:hypothetical protein